MANYELIFDLGSQYISAALKNAGYEIDKKKIVISAPIKKLGLYDVEIKLISGVPCKVKLKVDAE